MSDNAPNIKIKKKKSQAQRSKSEVADRHLCNFEIYRQKGDIRQSFYCLCVALTALPSLRDTYYSSFLEVFESWSAEVEEDEDFQEALKVFEVALKHYPESADLKYLLSKILYRHGNVYEGWSYACLAESECPQDPNARENRGRLANALIDRWHMPMLNDAQRNEFFRNAIEAAVSKGHDEVLDIGSGTGLLSIFAKRAGAKKIYGCEVDKFMCEIATNVIASNTDGRGIHILNLHSKNLTIPTHIPNKLSLVVTETVDAGLLGEHILSTLQYAWAHLLLPPPPSKGTCGGLNDPSSKPSNPKLNEKDVTHEEEKDITMESLCQDISSKVSVKFGKVIPSNADVFVALISCRYIAHITRLDDVDLLKYFGNRRVRLMLDEPYMSEKICQVPGGFELLSKWEEVTRIDFNSPQDINNHLNGLVSKTLELNCTNEGTADALVLAFNLQLDDSHCINTFPETCSAAWENALYPIFHAPKFSLNDAVKINFSCHGILDLSVQHEVPIQPEGVEDTIYLSANAMNFLSVKKLMTEYLTAAREITMKWLSHAQRNSSHAVVICDITPFPIAAIAVISLLPKVQLYVEEEDILKILNRMGIAAKLTEDLEEEVDILFMWPVTKEGTLQDGIMKKILMYRLMMAEGGIAFPQELDLVVDAVHSSEIPCMTQVDDANTCGVKISELFNIAKTNHQVDVHLDTLPHISVLDDPLHILQFSLTSGDVKILECISSESCNVDLLVLGGDAVTVQSKASAIRSSTVNALPYWFILRANMDCTKFSFCTRQEDSFGKQSLLILDKPYNVQVNENFNIKVIWRDGVFCATLTQST